MRKYTWRRIFVSIHIPSNIDIPIMTEETGIKHTPKSRGNECLGKRTQEMGSFPIALKMLNKDPWRSPSSVQVYEKPTYFTYYYISTKIHIYIYKYTSMDKNPVLLIQTLKSYKKKCKAMLLLSIYFCFKSEFFYVNRVCLLLILSFYIMYIDS